MDELWRLSMKDYVANASQQAGDWWPWDNMDDVIESYYLLFKGGGPIYHAGGPGPGRHITWGVHDPPGEDGSAIAHFFGSAAWENYSYSGRPAQLIHEGGLLFPTDMGSEAMRDTAYAYAGVEFASVLNRWFADGPRNYRIAQRFANGEIRLSDMLGPNPVVEDGIVYNDIYRFRDNARETMERSLGD